MRSAKAANCVKYMGRGKSNQQGVNPALYWNANKPDMLAVLLAFALTLAIHALVFVCIPYVPSAVAKDADSELEIVVQEPQFSRRIPDVVEANPYANSEQPVSQNAPESFMNQRVADEVTDPDSKSNMPYVEGEIENGRKIVQGTSSQADALTAASEVLETLERPLVQPANPAEMARSQPAESGGAPGQAGGVPENEGQKNSGDADLNPKPGASPETASNAASGPGDASGAKVASGAERAAEKEDAAPLSDNAEMDVLSVNAGAFSQSPGKAEAEARSAGESAGGADKTSSGGARGGQEPGGGNVAQASTGTGRQQEEKPEAEAEPSKVAEDTPQPKTRPTLSMKIPMGPLANNRTRASNQGTIAVDSRFSEFGAYQQRMLEAISRQWNLLGSQYDLSGAVGTQVVIEFYLNVNGELSRPIQTLFSNSTHLGKGLCEQSILSTAPYGEWTREMILTLGTQACPVRITFHYR